MPGHATMLETLRTRYLEAVARDIADEIPATDRHRYECNLRFAHQRIEEGREIASYLRREYGNRRLTILDAGAGNGGVALSLAAESNHCVVALDVVPNQTLADLRRSTGIAVRQVVATADQLPFRASAFDVVLCLDTIEHLPDARKAGEEMMQVIRSAGQIMITTPARVRFLFRRDPHFGIPGLLLLPDAWQRALFVKWLRRGGWDVEHIYWLARSIIALFPMRGRTETLINIPWPPPPRRRADWWQLLRHHVFKRLRQVLWDRIVIYKR